LNNDLADLLLQEREEIARILRFISQLIADAAGEIRVAIQIAGEIDALQACAIFADVIGAHRPSFNNDRRLHLIDARHPLLDERGSGTDPEEGAALAAAVIEHFLARGALLIVTTHLSSVKSFAMNDSRVINASMEFDGGHSTYRLIVGIPGRSRAIEVAQM